MLLARTNYLWYFESSAQTFAISFAVSSGETVTEFNLKRAPGLGDRLVILPAKTLSGSPIAINLAGFRRLDGPAFMTIQ